MKIIGWFLDHGILRFSLFLLAMLLSVGMAMLAALAVGKVLDYMV